MTPADHPRLVRAGAPAVAEALAAGGVVALPAAGGYQLVVQAGSPEREARLSALVGDTGDPLYTVGGARQVRALTDGWNEELAALLARCWPGPLEVMVAAPGQGSVRVGTPDRRDLRRLCRAHGPWRTVAVPQIDAAEASNAFTADQVALVVEGSPRSALRPTVVDATVSPVHVVREGALPASFVEAAVLMGARRRRWRGRRPTS